MMIFWLRHLWNSQSTLGANGKRCRLLRYDQHKVQMTKVVKDILHNECKTTLALVPPRATAVQARFSPWMLWSTASSKKPLITWQQWPWPNIPISSSFFRKMKNGLANFPISSILTSFFHKDGYSSRISGQTQGTCIFNQFKCLFEAVSAATCPVCLIHSQVYATLVSTEPFPWKTGF